MSATLIRRDLGRMAYADSWRAMRRFVDERSSETLDECWFLEHPSVYTQGQAGRATHIHNPGEIPVVQTDRGGQVTYHGPGQLVVYTLFDLRRLGIGVRTMVQRLENTVVALLRDYSITATGNRSAPGVYIEAEKVAALGLRVRKGCTYHGLALNVAMDLHPYDGIDPCGYSNLRVCDLAQHGVNDSLAVVADNLCHCLCREFRYNRVDSKPTLEQL
ncbi:MAG: lipoyl(octanoyl) transferase LipB [Pseudomonadota bacterium]